MFREYTIKVDVLRGLLEATLASFKQLNSGTCKLNFELTNNYRELNLTNLRLMITIETPSGQALEDPVKVVDAVGGKCEYLLTNAAMTEDGSHSAEINIYDATNTKLLTTARFRYIVESRLGEQQVQVDTRYTTLQELIFEVTELKTSGVVNIAKVEELLTEAAHINAASEAINLETQLLHAESRDVNAVSKAIQAEVQAAASQTAQDAAATQDNASEVAVNTSTVVQLGKEVHINAQAAAEARQAAQGYAEGAATSRLAAETAKTQAQAQADIATQKAQEINSSAGLIERAKQALVDSIPMGAKSGQLYFTRKVESK